MKIQEAGGQWLENITRCFFVCKNLVGGITWNKELQPEESKGQSPRNSQCCECQKCAQILRVKIKPMEVQPSKNN